jgi:2-polyprenyl-3-methyl-5-hydroxy-6-metoxy-1,4-benzoquinol methylase
MKKCKICQNTENKKLAGLCSNMRIMGTSFEDGGCDIVVCTKCGFVYNQYENAAQSNFDEYYLSDSSKTVNYYDVYPQKLADEYFEHIYDNIKDYIHKDSRILDIAGGYGELSEYLINKGYTDVTMLEMKQPCIQYAKNKGINVLEGNLLKLQSYDEQYDFIICSHDLEHFIDIDTALERIKKLMKPDGMLYIEVPDIEEYANLDRAPYHFLTYEHVCHFSKNTIHNIANQFGFEIVYLKKYVKCDDYPCLYSLMRHGAEVKDTVQDDVSEKAMLKYIDKSRQEIMPVTEEFEISQKKLILWGIGASTAQLLNGHFDKCNVIQIVDSNKARQGVAFKIGERRLCVEDSTEIKDKEAVIFILPTAYKDSIIKAIRNHGFENDVVSLK